MYTDFRRNSTVARLMSISSDLLSYRFSVTGRDEHITPGAVARNVIVREKGWSPAVSHDDVFAHNSVLAYSARWRLALVGEPRLQQTG